VREMEGPPLGRVGVRRPLAPRDRLGVSMGGSGGMSSDATSSSSSTMSSSAIGASSSLWFCGASSGVGGRGIASPSLSHRKHTICW
jgi:hypothetical protein